MTTLSRAREAEAWLRQSALEYRYPSAEDGARFYLEAADSLSALIAECEWRDIASAPKDGTCVIVAWRRPDNGVYVVGEAWRGGDEKQQWWWANTDFSDYAAEPLLPDPTHWRPLPTPPQPVPVGEGETK